MVTLQAQMGGEKKSKGIILGTKNAKVCSGPRGVSAEQRGEADRLVWSKDRKNREKNAFRPTL